MTKKTGNSGKKAIEEETRESIKEDKAIKKGKSFLNGLGLKPKEKLFIIYYIENHWNGTKAYIKAGYKSKSEAASAVAASLLLRNSKVVEGLHSYIESILNPCKEALKKQLYDIWFYQAFYDPTIFYNPDGTLAFKTWEEVPKEYHCCVESIEKKYYRVGVNQSREAVVLKLIDRKWAQLQLDKFIQMTKDTKVLEIEEVSLEQREKLKKIFEE